VAADEVAGPMLWTKQFLEAQAYPVTRNTLYQDNRSAMLLETNGRQSAGKRSRHLNIRMFFVADQVKKGSIDIEYCPTDDMTGDYMTKPLHGKKFVSFRNEIMNLSPTSGNSGQASIVQQECVESDGSNLKSRSNLKIHGEGGGTCTLVQRKKRKRRFPQ
jgi:hypothetical protein